MDMPKMVALVLALCAIMIFASIGICHEPDSSKPGTSEQYLFKRLETFESVKTDQDDAIEGERWQL